MQYLKVRNWDKWQTYRSDRGKPPWIKIHRCLQQDWEWVDLSDKHRGQLVAIWLLASSRDGVIPASPEKVQKLCNMSDLPDLNLLIELNFLEGAAIVASTGCQEVVTDKIREVKLSEVKVSEDKQLVPQAAPVDVQTIFDHWKLKLNHPRSNLDQKRITLIKKALAIGYPVSDLILAITGCSLTPHNIGQNDRGTRYDSLNIIFKDGDNIDRFMANGLNPPVMPAREKTYEEIRDNLTRGNTYEQLD